MHAFPSCGVDSGSPFNVPREERADETLHERSEEAAQRSPAGKRAEISDTLHFLTHMMMNQVDIELEEVFHQYPIFTGHHPYI